MRAISLWQPWASAIADGLKVFETRGWKPLWTGTLAIHAAKTKNPITEEFLAEQRFLGRFQYELPRGAIVAVCEMLKPIRTEDIFPRLTELEREFGDYTPGRWAWPLGRVQKLSNPFPVAGHQGFFDVDIPQSHLPCDVPANPPQNVKPGEGWMLRLVP